MSEFATRPFFMESPQGPIFAVHHLPKDPRRLKGNILCVPPFNEEMNRCRSMITLTAEALARVGWGTLLVDLHGTGDSAGGYVDARWTIWLDNLTAASAWLAQQPGGHRAVWGIRLGAILACEWHAVRADPALALLLWQPVSEGKTHLTQFMRVKIAASMDRPDLPKESTATMRATLAAGQPVEIAGYELHPDLTRAIDGARLADHRPPDGTRLLWLEAASAADDPKLSPGTQALMERWPGPAVRASAQTFTGPAFWQVYERVVAPSIIEASTTWLTQEAVSP